jgi:hypothetical protein
MMPWTAASRGGEVLRSIRNTVPQAATLRIRRSTQLQLYWAGTSDASKWVLHGES